MIDILKTREVTITKKLWSFFWKTIAITVLASVLTHIAGYPPDVGSALRWGLPSLLVLAVGGFLLRKTSHHCSGKYVLIIITTVIVFIGIWVTPSPFLLGFYFITVIFSVFYLNQRVTLLSITLNSASAIILIFVYPRINTVDGPVVDSLNILLTYVVVGVLLYLLSKELSQTLHEHAAAREMQNILSFGSEDGMIVIDRGFQVLEFKDYQTEPIFAGNEEKIIGQDFLTIDFFKPLRSILQADKSIHSKEIEIAVDGKYYPCLFSYFATKTARQRNIHSVILFKNLTKQRLLEKQLELTAKWSLTGDIAAGLAHEIRNPITVVKGYLELINTCETEPKHKQWIDLMLDEIERANALLTDFLYVSKPQALEYIDCPLEKLISDVVNLIYPTATLKDISIETNIEPNLPNVQIDARQFKQVLLNILKNSIEATGQSGVIKISVFSKDGPLTIQISDSGIGISQEHLQKIFDPFFSTKAEGTGLGLSVSYRILRDHGCNVNVESEVGVGTKFVIQFASS